MGFRDSVIMKDNRMLLLSAVMVVLPVLNLGLVWQVLDGEIQGATILPVTGLITVFWFIVWTADMRIIEGETYIFKDTIVLLAGMAATTVFILVAIITEGYHAEETVCVIQSIACIDHSFTATHSIGGIALSLLVFLALTRIIPDTLFTEMAGELRHTPLFGAWGDEPDEMELGRTSGVQRLQEVWLDQTTLDDVMTSDRITGYHRYTLAALAPLIALNAVLWDRIPETAADLAGIEGLVLTVVFLQLLVMRRPDIVESVSGAITQRQVTYGLSVADGGLAGALIGTLLIHPSMFLDVSGTVELAVVAVPGLIGAVVAPVIVRNRFDR